jgi:hypothetical protein
LQKRDVGLCKRKSEKKKGEKKRVLKTMGTKMPAIKKEG